MNSHALPPDELMQLRAQHRQTREKRYADRLKSVILLGSGWSAVQVIEALLIDPDTARSHFKRYRQGGIQGRINRGGAGWLNDETLIELDLHLRQKLYLTAKEVARSVEERYGLRYTERGMTALLHRLGYVYKKPELVPGKADAEAQRAFLESYEKTQERQGLQGPDLLRGCRPSASQSCVGLWLAQARRGARAAQ